MKTSQRKIKDCFKVLGKNISHVRKAKKMTLEQLGFDIGMDKSAMHHIENGKPITLTTLIKIAAVLEINTTTLLKNIPRLTKNDIL